MPIFTQYEAPYNSPKILYRQCFALTARKYLVVAGKPDDGIWDDTIFLLNKNGKKAVQVNSIEDIRNEAGSTMALTFVYSNQSELERLKELTSSDMLYFVHS